MYPWGTELYPSNLTMAQRHDARPRFYHYARSVLKHIRIPLVNIEGALCLIVLAGVQEPDDLNILKRVREVPSILYRRGSRERPQGKEDLP